MKKCTELLKNEKRSLVEVRETDTDRVEKYVVCYDFDNSKAYGNKWVNGEYYTVDVNAEEQLKKATMNLYGIDKRDLPYERLKDLAMMFLRELKHDYDNECLKEFLLETAEIDKVEAEIFGVKDIVFPEMLKIVEVILKREQSVCIRVAVPADIDDYYVEGYIDNYDYLEDDPSIANEDWEIDECYTDTEEISKKEFKDRYDGEEIWNYEDVDDFSL